ncbi:MAG: ROK-family transcriptional regulator [Frondihabitans sp.]|nr:ROK-family transcriptional regulator [Frondihabitans sp.]
MIRTPTRADGAEPRGDILPDDIVTDMPLSPRNTSVPGNPSRSLAGTDTSAVRRLNTSAALRAILSVDGPATLAQLTAATSLSRRTIESILSELTLHGWVDELESRSSTGGAGRPSKRYSVRPQNALIAALRIDTFATTAVVSDVLGRELGRATRVLPDYFDPENTLATAAEALDAAIAETGLSATRIRGGALASGGAIEDESVIRHIVFAPTWSGVDARAALSLRFDFPWFVDNDANLAARA